jgi:transcriptional regulator GlxA family with amidase domain
MPALRADNEPVRPGRDRQDLVLSASGGLRQDRAVDRSERTVVLVVFDRCQLLDLAGPADVLRAATLLGADPAYRIRVATPDGSAVRAENGVIFGGDASLRDLVSSPGPIDTLLVVGGVGVDAFARDDLTLAALRQLSARARRTTSVCSGALALAAAGLLDGYRATTHWSSCGRLAAEHPEVEVEPDQIYVHDRDRWTSAGVTAATDLALALVEDDHGPELAHAVAGWLVVFVRRPGGQAQFSAQLLAAPARSPGIADVQRWLPDHLAADLSVAALAARAGMSPRHFARAFHAETGTTPAAFVDALRVEAARRLLETSDLTVPVIAAAVGLRHGETLHRAFQRRLATTPDRYRQHFRRQAG